MPNEPLYAREFTPELTAEFLSGRLRDIDTMGAQEEGRARSEAAERGLLGQNLEGSLVGLARQGTAQRKSDEIARFNYDVANLRRQERLTKEGRAYESDEARKAREFQEKLADMRYQFEEGEASAQRGFEKVQGQQGLVEGGLFGLASSALGGYLGGLNRIPEKRR